MSVFADEKLTEEELAKLGLWVDSQEFCVDLPAEILEPVHPHAQGCVRVVSSKVPGKDPGDDLKVG